MSTGRDPSLLTFQPLPGRQVVASFSTGPMTSDGGLLILREANRVFNITDRLAECFTDHRSKSRTAYPVKTLVSRRVMALALGCEDINDPQRMRHDLALAVACDGPDVDGRKRYREQDRGPALALPSTLNRLERPIEKTLARSRRRCKVGYMVSALPDVQELEPHAACGGQGGMAAGSAGSEVPFCGHQSELAGD